MERKKRQRSNNVKFGILKAFVCGCVYVCLCVGICEKVKSL